VRGVVINGVRGIFSAWFSVLLGLRAVIIVYYFRCTFLGYVSLRTYRPALTLAALNCWDTGQPKKRFSGLCTFYY